MRLRTRTSIAAAVAAALVIVVLGVFFRGRVQTVLRQRVDRQLVERAETAPILAAVGDRLAISELGATVEGARILREGMVVTVGEIPNGRLPAIDRPGWRTVRIDGESWRLYTVAVDDVPRVGDHALVQLVEPLGDVDALARRQRRVLFAAAILGILASAVVGYVLGALASRPLGRLRRDAARVGDSAVDGWRTTDRYGAVEIDEVAGVLDAGLARVAEEIRERQAALDAARAFAASAAHELRTPLTGAVANLDIARRDDIDAIERRQTIDEARDQLHRMAASLTALRGLADAGLADPAWFVRLDLADLVSIVVESERRQRPRASIEFAGPGDDLVVTGWEDGLRLAVSNLIRNAVDHGRRVGGGPGHVWASLDHSAEWVSVTIDDDGPGIPVDDRARLVRRFELGPSSAGSGLGLALVQQVAFAHGGSLSISDSPAGGARVVLSVPADPDSSTGR